MLLMYVALRRAQVYLPIFHQVPQEAFVQAASKVSRQITPEVLAGYERWKRSSGAASAY